MFENYDPRPEIDDEYEEKRRERDFLHSFEFMIESVLNAFNARGNHENVHRAAADAFGQEGDLVTEWLKSKDPSKPDSEHPYADDDPRRFSSIQDPRVRATLRVQFKRQVEQEQMGRMFGIDWGVDNR